MSMYGIVKQQMILKRLQTAVEKVKEDNTSPDSQEATSPGKQLTI